MLFVCLFEGVNPNAITAAGVALVALSGISSTAGLGPGALGIGGAVLAGVKKTKKMFYFGNLLCLCLTKLLRKMLRIFPELYPLTRRNSQGLPPLISLLCLNISINVSSRPGGDELYESVW